MVLIAGGCALGGENGDRDQHQFEVFTWYTSGSEAAAKELLFEHLTEETGVEIVDGAVAGASGTNAQAVLQSRLQGGDAPETWQTYAGTALEAYVDSDYLMDLTDIYETEGLADGTLPEAVIEGLTVNGSIYGVGAGGISQGNMLWYNVDLMSEVGIEMTEETTYEEFLESLDKLSDAGITPLCLGDSAGYGSRVEFEAALSAALTSDEWMELFAGELEWTSPTVTAAVEEYMRLRPYHNSDNATLDWTDATRMLGEGDCAAMIMGGWAYGELLNQGYEEGQDFDYVAFPGSSDKFVAVADTFVISQETPEQHAEAWVRTLTDPDVQVAFSHEKSTVPTNESVDVDDLDAYAGWATEQFRDEEVDVIYSLNSGSVAPPAFMQAYQDALVSLHANEDVGVYTETLAAITNSEQS